MSNDLADFHGLPFETDYMLFAVDELDDIPSVYVIYTSKACLEIGETPRLRTHLEEHANTQKWIELSGGEDIFIAFHPDEDTRSRLDKVSYLVGKMRPVI
jgi:hypothetical protein